MIASSREAPKHHFPNNRTEPVNPSSHRQQSRSEKSQRESSFPDLGQQRNFFRMVEHVWVSFFVFCFLDFVFWISYFRRCISVPHEYGHVMAQLYERFDFDRARKILRASRNISSAQYSKTNSKFNPSNHGYPPGLSQARDT
jgi:hypothetical protein